MKVQTPKIELPDAQRRPFMQFGNSVPLEQYMKNIQQPLQPKTPEQMMRESCCERCRDMYQVKK